MPQQARFAQADCQPTARRHDCWRAVLLQTLGAWTVGALIVLVLSMLEWRRWHDLIGTGLLLVTSVVATATVTAVGRATRLSREQLGESDQDVGTK